MPKEFNNYERVGRISPLMEHVAFVGAVITAAAVQAGLYVSDMLPPSIQQKLGL